MNQLFLALKNILENYGIKKVNPDFTMFLMNYLNTILNELFDLKVSYRRFKFSAHLKAKLRRNRHRLNIFLLVLIIVIFYVFGLFTLIFEKSFDTEFSYPLDVPNFRLLIESIKSESFKFDHHDRFAPVNNYSFHYRRNPLKKCLTDRNSTYPIALLLVVKSAACNYVLRSVIRQTWGFESRFSDVNIQTVFILGRCSDQKCLKSFHDHPQLTLSKKSKKFVDTIHQNQTLSLNCQQITDIEQDYFGDLVQADFVDSYYNNTLKTMASLQWTKEHCSNVPLILFVDDDYYVSVKNLLKFSRNYLNYVENKIEDKMESDYETRLKQMALKFDGRLYAGFIFPRSRPMRHLPSKWFISLEEYPFNRYPPYVTGGCFLVNNRTVEDLYYASQYTKPFKYDDVYLGILAYRMQIQLIAVNHEIHFSKLPYDRKNYFSVIASHGYHDPIELWDVWNEQKTFGHA